MDNLQGIRNTKIGSTVTPTFISSLSYTDFIGLINQWNVPPGSYVTLSKWAAFSGLSEKSHLLEVACTTGFSSRELAVLTGCSGEGFDISEKSVEMAIYNKDKFAPHAKLSYRVADGYTYTTKDPFTHVVVGAALGFFPDPQKMLESCISMLRDGGHILAAPFYVTEPIPDDLIARAQETFEITPTQISYKEIMKLYNKLEIVFEEHNCLVEETEEELHHYCKSTIERACEMLGIKGGDVFDAMYARLLAIKKMSNDLRPFQRYAVLVLRYRRDVYPNRYVELF